MKSVATQVAIAVLVVAGLLVMAGWVGAPTGAATSATPTVAARASAPAQQVPPGRIGAEVPLQLNLQDMTPRTVTADGPDTLTLSGTMVNTGEQPVDDLAVRIQRGGPLTTEGAVRDALDGNAPTDAVTPQFVPLADSVAPGGSVPVHVSIPLRGDPQNSLALNQNGVYELLVNVNGSPDGGTRARVAAVRLLLPVQSLPAGGGQPAGRNPTPTGSRFAMLYPISDRPQAIVTVPGEQPLLADDGLAASFAPGGRLNGLVTALAEQAPVGSPIRAATCVAIDPDLVATADAMRHGYRVRTHDGTVVPGVGAASAGAWLEALAAVVRGGCVVALPYADADLVALTRNGLTAQAATAITDGREVLADRLGVPTSALPAVTWPADGAVDGLTLDTIHGAGDRSLVLSADSVAQGRTRSTSGVVPLTGGTTAVLSDPLLSLAARGPVGATAGSGLGEAVETTSLSGTDTPLSTQDAIATLAFRVQNANPAADGPLLLAPPRRWAVDGTGARALLASAATLVADGALAPRGILDALRTGPPAGAQRRSPEYPAGARAREVPTTVFDTLGHTGSELADLQTAAAEPGPDSVGVSPEEAFGPVRDGLLRPASATLHGSPDDAENLATDNDARVAAMRASIAVLEPPVPYSLGTSDAPLPLTVVNGLPVTVRVRVEVAPTAGLRVAAIPDQTIPPLGRRQLSVTANVTRSGQFSVDATVRTPGGGQLGEPSRLKVVSTAYGTITVWLTATAGVLLVALVARRVIRRRRGERNDHRGPGRREDPRNPTADPLQDSADPLLGADTERLPVQPPRGAPAPRVADHLAMTEPFRPAPVDPPWADPSDALRSDPPRTPTPRS